jgi:ornithine cyclodeaminase
VTKWKTVMLSVGGAFAGPDSRNILIVVWYQANPARYLRRCFSSECSVQWFGTARLMGQRVSGGQPRCCNQHDLEAAVGAADIVTSAMMSTDPLIKGAWLETRTTY